MDNSLFSARGSQGKETRDAVGVWAQSNWWNVIMESQMR